MSPYKRGTAWYIEFTDEAGVRQRKSTSARTKAQAEVLEAKALLRVDEIRLGVEVSDRNPAAHTVSTARDWYLKGPAKGQANAKNLRNVLARHLVGELATAPIERVTTGMVNRWLDEREATGISPTTVNKLRAYLSGLFTELLDHELLFGDHPVRRAKLRDVEPPMPRALPADIVLDLIDNAPTRGWSRVIALGAYTGMRLSELRRLRKRDVDLVEGIIYVRKTKTKKPRRVAIHPEVRAVLEGAQGDIVIGKGGWARAADMVRRAAELAGVTFPDGVDGVFHSLRHTWSTQLIVCGADGEVVRAMGWAPRRGDTFAEHYLNLPAAKLAAEMAKLVYPRRAPVLEIHGTNPPQAAKGGAR